MTPGKVLSYHSALDTEEIISVGSSVETPITRYGSRERRSCSSFRSTQMLSIAFLVAIIVAGLSSFSIDANNNAHSLRTTVTKFTGVADTTLLGIQQIMMDVDSAAIKASSSQIAFWDPFLVETSAFTNSENLMNIVSLCSARPTFLFRMGEHGSYTLQPSTAMEPPYMQGQDLLSSRTISDQLTLPSLKLPMAVFTPNFSQTALELFDHSNKGAFVIMFRDPKDIYYEQYGKGRGQPNVPGSNVNDNLVVRHLSGVNNRSRRVNRNDYDVAKQMLMSKFVVVSCDDSVETLRRLGIMTGFSGGKAPRCNQAQRKWNQECKKTKETGQQSKSNISHLEILQNIESEHRFDILLYEDSKIIFRQQHALFGVGGGR
ncbi:hypothetical protein ACHAXA_006071 [Cyclostephanos tholiformis]|uniref:Uncharacterized protein n=1 Tax=Cyclostephanos tholiformis TaxID=382380 RepID=A0ABD3SB50_9STRA